MSSVKQILIFLTIWGGSLLLALFFLVRSCNSDIEQLHKNLKEKQKTYCLEVGQMKNTEVKYSEMTEICWMKVNGEFVEYKVKN